MAKSIIKEIIIILLLLLAIILALGVLFYDYIPNNKSIPSVHEYKTAESIERELQENITEEEDVIKTYEITQEDLKDLQKSKSYVGGKANPFSTYEEATLNSVDGNMALGTVGTNEAGFQGTVNTNNGGTFYKNTGTK